MSWYEITLEGFTVQNQTWDTLWQTDGKADEVYIYTDARLYDQAGNLLLRSERQTDTIGDTNGFPFRVRAGSASALGGLRTGDHFPYAPPWQRQGVLQNTRPPMLLWAGELTDQRAVTITPTIWEWDGGTDLFNEWGRALVDNGPAIAAAVINIINATQGAIIPTDVIKTNLEMGLPPLYKLLNNILGQAGDRPIGMVEEGGNAVFKSKSLAMNNRLAEVAVTNDFGYGPGIVGIQYQDSARLAGNYMLYLKVTKTGDSFTFNDGTLWKERSSAPVYVMFGGAKFWIPSPDWLRRYGDWSRVTVAPDGALAAVPVIPSDGTVLREWSSASVYVIQGGQKRWITTPAVLDRFGGWPVVRVVPDGGLALIPDGQQIN